MTQEQPHGVKWWQIALERANEMAGQFFTIILDPMLRLKMLGQAIPNPSENTSFHIIDRTMFLTQLYEQMIKYIVSYMIIV